MNFKFFKPFIKWVLVYTLAFASITGMILIGALTLEYPFYDGDSLTTTQWLISLFFGFISFGCFGVFFTTITYIVNFIRVKVFEPYFNWYIGKAWRLWYESKSRSETFKKRGLPEIAELRLEKLFIAVVYTVLMPLVLLEWGVRALYKRLRRN